jgi:hypothetical protein
MTVTILATAFIIIMLAVALFGIRYVMQGGKGTQDSPFESCAVCKTRLEKSRLVERQIGDARPLFFCDSCIRSLHNELLSRN